MKEALGKVMVAIVDAPVHAAAEQLLRRLTDLIEKWDEQDLAARAASLASSLCRDASPEAFANFAAVLRSTGPTGTAAKAEVKRALPAIKKWLASDLKVAMSPIFSESLCRIFEFGSDAETLLPSECPWYFLLSAWSLLLTKKDALTP